MSSAAPVFDLQPRQGARDLLPSRIREIANRAMGRSDIAAFWFGESDQPTPDFIRDAAKAALDRQETFYTQNLGLPALREAIALYLTRLHGMPFGAGRIAVTGSGVSALMLAAQMLLESGDRVVMVTPIWPNIAEIPRIVGAHVARVGLEARGGKWRLDLDALLAALTPDVRVLVLNSPANPTGWTITVDEQRIILAHCRRLGIWIVADDAYERLSFLPGGKAPSFLTLATPEDRVVSVNTFSKAWLMTGWRVGWLVVPEQWQDDLAKVIEYNTSCVAGFIQQGAIAALDPVRGEALIDVVRSSLLLSRDHLLAGLAALPGIEAPVPDGAMYAFFRIAGHADDMALARALVDAGLGLAPGSAFGPEGEGWLRWCFASSPERIDLGLERLGRYLRL